MRKSVVFHPFLSYQEVGELKAAFVGEDISKVRLKSRCLVLHFVDEKFTSTFWEVSLLILDQGNKVFQLSLFISWVFIRIVILYFFLFWGGLISIILDLDPINSDWPRDFFFSSSFFRFSSSFSSLYFYLASFSRIFACYFASFSSYFIFRILYFSNSFSLSFSYFSLFYYSFLSCFCLSIYSFYFIFNSFCCNFSSLSLSTSSFDFLVRLLLFFGIYSEFSPSLFLLDDAVSSFFFSFFFYLTGVAYIFSISSATIFSDSAIGYHWILLKSSSSLRKST